MPPDEVAAGRTLPLRCLYMIDLRWAIVGLLVYVAPTLYALVRRTPKVVLICVINVFFGWTVAGWFVALALAVLLPKADSDSTRFAGAAGDAPIDPLPAEVLAQPVDFVIDPARVAVGSLIGPIIYPYWWLWRFFRFAQQQQFPRSRNFLWIFVPLYGYAVIGRLFHDLQSRLGSSRPTGFNAQTAIALIVAGNVAAAWGLRLSYLPFLVAGLALGCVFTAMALYQVQSGVNAYLRMTHGQAPEAGLFLGESAAVLASLALLSALALGAKPLPALPVSQTFDNSQLPVVTGTPWHSPSSTASPLPSPTATPTPITHGNDVLSLTSQPGDYIGQGKAMTMTPPAWKFSAAQMNGPDNVTITIESTGSSNFTQWTVWLAAPRGQVLGTGSYNNATRAAFRSGSSPGIDVFGDGRGCNNVYGSFVVKALVVDSQGNVQAFDASFEQHCESPTAPPLQGTVHFGGVAQTQAVAPMHPAAYLR